MRSANHPSVMESELRTSSDHQAKAFKGQSLLAVGLRRIRTLSGVYQKRPQQQRPPLPPIAPVCSSERNLLSLALVSLPEQKQGLVSPAIQPCNNSPRLIDANDSGPFSPCVSHLQGIHFVREANQDPDLDADESTLNLSWPQSTQSEKSSAVSPSEDANNRLSGHSRSFSINWSEKCVSPSPLSMTHSDSSSMSDSSLMSRMLEKIPPKLLSRRTCNMASPPIDCESPYAPYAPTSPLSANIISDSQLPNHSAPTIPFNIRSALRGTLPSKISRSTMKPTTLRHRKITQDLQVTCESSGLGSYPSSSSSKVCSPKIFTSDPTPLATLGRDIWPNQLTSPNPGFPPSISCSVASKVIKTGNRRPGNSDHCRRHSTSPGPPSSIPFPGSDHEEELPETAHERTRSQSSISHFRNQLNNFWGLPINRLRTPSSISTVIRGIRPGKRRSPSDVSFEPRPYSMRSESSYEILDSSSIPPV